MRASLSMLTSASSSLADALQKRNQEYDGLMAQHAMATRRVDALQTELNLAQSERAGFAEQVNERNAQLVDLHTRLDNLASDLQSAVDAKAPLEAQVRTCRPIWQNRWPRSNG